MTAQQSNIPPFRPFSSDEKRTFEHDLVYKLRRVFGQAEVFRSSRTRMSFRLPTIEAPYFWIEAVHGAKADPAATLRNAIERCEKTGKKRQKSSFS